MTTIRNFTFKPGFGLSSKHLQMIISAYLPGGREPPSENWIVEIGRRDKLSCLVSTPPTWTDENKTIVLIHGMGGSASSRYMVRMARKLYARNDRVVRINLRNCGSGRGLSTLPYCAGNSSDIFKILLKLKDKHPRSNIQLIGYSLGGNISLKLAGELGRKSYELADRFIAVCPPLNLAESVEAILDHKNRFYHSYYLRNILKQGKPWIKKNVRSLYQLDDRFTGPLWGFENADEYYNKCSCINFLSSINQEAHILIARDDPFVPLTSLQEVEISKDVTIWASDYGSHMGFLGPLSWQKFQWMDQLLLKLTNGEAID